MTTSIYCWNVNGIRAAQRKGFLDWLRQVDPDILCVQETKARPDQLDEALRNPDGYHAYWSSSVRPGYSGVALFSKTEPKSVRLGMGIDEYDQEGRTIIAEYDDFTLITAYFPNGGRDQARLDFKMSYKAAFLDLCNGLCESGKPLIFCGDINTAHMEIDLARPKQNKNTTGFMPMERAWLDAVVKNGYVDIFRTRNPELSGAYTWWYQIGNSRAKNVGWRLDMFFVTPDLQDRIIDAQIHPEMTGSDHCPVSITLR